MASLFALIILVNVLRYYSFHLDSNSIPTSTTDPRSWLHIFPTHVRVDALLFGCLLKIIEPYFSMIKQNHRKILAHICAVVSLLIFLRFILVGFSSWKWIEYTLTYVAAGLLIASCILHDHWLNKILEINGLRWIGRNSYALYLWHFPLLFIFARFGKDQNIYVVICLYITLALFVGWISTKFIENYFLRIRAKLAP